MRSVLAAVVAFVAMYCAAGAYAAPNLVVLMADDLDEATLDRARDLGLMPHFERAFGEEGLRFTESFVTNALCCPSRATFLTGQYTHNHGVLNITHDAATPQGSFSAFDDREHLGVWLQRAGYRTGMIGKFLNGYGYVPPRNCPTCDPMRYVPPGWDAWQAMPDYGERHGDPGILYAGAYCMYNYTINVDGTLVTHGGADADYQTDVLARRAAAFVGGLAGDVRPFFLYLAPIAPHFELCLPAATPFEYDVRGAPRHRGTVASDVGLDRLVPSYDEIDVSDKPAWHAREYPPMRDADKDALDRGLRHRLEALRGLDDMIGTLRTALERAGRWDDTVFVFTSDNGWLNGEHRAWGKVLPYEGSIRVPLFVRGPGIDAAQLRDGMVLNTDLAPTLLARAGGEAGVAMDGRDLAPLVASPHPVAWRRRGLVEHFRDASWAPVSWADFAAVRTSRDDADAPSQMFVDWRVDDVRVAVEHYRLMVDPWQVDSLGASLREPLATQRASLVASLAALRECGKAGRPGCAAAEDDTELVFHGSFD
ncbi:sulfatase family protein [Dokdonella sp. MW10]|uniref:sulfatase family protein n=1 Tax=Dokdonella sp. MW10 TaxID=2992926 RepID=UPI003F7D91C2